MLLLLCNSVVLAVNAAAFNNILITLITVIIIIINSIVLAVDLAYFNNIFITTLTVIIIIINNILPILSYYLCVVHVC